jgi:hypothetical protein
MFEEYQKRVLPALLKERVQRRLQSDSESESQEIRQTKENIERIITSIFSEVMEDLFQQWHQPQEQQASGFPALNDAQTPVSTSVSQFQPPRHGMAAFYVAPPSVPTSNSLSLSDFNPLRQGVQSSKPTSDSGYYSARTSSYGHLSKSSTDGPSSSQPAKASQHHPFALPSSSRFSDRQATSSYVDPNAPGFKQLDSNTERTVPMDLAFEAGNSQSSLGTIEQSELCPIGNAGRWTLDESQSVFAPSFLEPADGENKHLYLSLEHFDDQQIPSSSDLFSEFPTLEDFDFAADSLLQ